MKLLDASTPLAMEALQAIAAESLGRQLSEQERGGFPLCGINTASAKGIKSDP